MYNRIKLIDLLKEILSDNAKKKALEKFKKEKPEMGDAQINYYINKFSDKQASNVFQKKDIFQYKFNELEKLIDANFPSDVSTKKDDDEVDFKGSEDVIYNENNLLILLGDLKQKCIRYGKGYSWCISKPDVSNMYFSYRMRLNEPVFYFVLDEDKPKQDKHHAMVIYINNNGEYYVANSLNEGDEEMSWSEIETIQPKLKGLKNLFKHIPLNSEERNDYKRFKDPIDDSKYDKLTFTDKEKYIGFEHDLSEKQIRNTPKQLVSKYAVTTTGNNIPKEIEKSLPPSDQKKLRDNRIEIIGDQAKFIYYQDDLTSDDLKVEGELDFSNSTSLKSLPDGLKVEEDLNLTGCTSLESLPAGLKVGGYLYLIDCTSLTSLPADLSVEEGLDLTGCTSLESLPAGLKVGGYLDLSFCTSLKSLPNDLKVGGSLYLYGCTSLESLPAGLSVEGDLILKKCTSLTSLPADLSVERDLDLRDCTKLLKKYTKKQIRQMVPRVEGNINF